MKIEHILKVTEKERNQILYQRKLGYGKVVVHIEDGQPTRGEEAQKSVKF